MRFGAAIVLKRDNEAQRSYYVKVVAVEMNKRDFVQREEPGERGSQNIYT